VNFEVYAYWNTTELAAVFNAIAAITGGADFNGLLRTLALVAIISLAIAVLAGRSRMDDFWKWVVMLAIFHGMLLVPKSNVVIVDRTGTAPAQVVSNVPIGLAALAHGTSKIGDWLTKTFETVFSLPDDVQLRKNGTLFGHRIMRERLAAGTVNPILLHNLMEFYRECVWPDLATGYISSRDISEASDIWALFNNTNPGLLVTILDYNDPATSSTVSCPIAYSTLTSQLALDTDKNLEEIGKKLYPGMSAAAAKAAFIGSLQTTTNYLLGVSQSAQNILKQAIVANTIIDAEYTIPSQVGDAAQAQVKLAGAQAIRSFNTSYGTMAALADETMPKLRNAVEILTYAMFPIVVLIIVVSGQYAVTFLKTYLGALLWVQLWPPLYAVTNFIMNTKAASGLSSATDGDGLALKYYNYLGTAVATDQAIAGVLAVAIPVIAWGIVQATMAAANAVASSVTAGGAYGASLSQGNLTVGATNVDTTKAGLYTAGLYNMQPMLKGGVPNSMVAGEQGTVAQEGLIYRFSGSWGQASALDSNRDGRIAVDEITSFQGLGSSMFGGKAGLSLGQSRSDGIYSDESVQAGKGRAASLGDTQTARLTREQGAAWGRTFTQALNDEIGRETGGGVTTAAGHSSNTGSETTGQKLLQNQEGAGVNSGVGTGVGTASHGTPPQVKADASRKGLSGMLAEKIGNALAFSVSGDVRTGQTYAEQATQLMKTMSQDDVRKSYDIVSRALKKTAGTTSDQGMRQATERMAAALDKAKTFDSKELASIMEQASAGNRRDVTSRNAAEVSSDTSRELFKTAWMMLASRQGWDDTVTTERLATFAREWNSNASFREDAEVAMLERLKGNSLLQTGVRDPLAQDELRGRGGADVDALNRQGGAEVAAQNASNVGQVRQNQFADPRSMPSIAPAAQAYAQTMGQADRETQRRAAQMHLEQGINTVANALYHDRQKGMFTVLLNTYGFGAGSASPQEYAAKLREAAAKDPELARGLATIGMNHEQAKIGPTEQNLEWVLHKAGRSVAEAEGKGATAAYEVAGVWRWAKGLFSEEPGAPSELVPPQTHQPPVYGANMGAPGVASNQGDAAATRPAGAEQGGRNLGGPLSGTPGSSNLGKLLGGNQRQMPTQAQPTEGADSQQKAGDAPPPGNR
jgi:hypothetical protein